MQLVPMLHITEFHLLELTKQDRECIIPQSYSGIPSLGMKFNGDSLAVNNTDFSSNVNKEIRFFTLSSVDNKGLQKGNDLKFGEQATGIVSAL